MTNYAKISGYEGHVLVTSIDEELNAVVPSMKFEVLKTICMCGGAMSLNITEEMTTNPQANSMLTAAGQVAFQGLKPGPLVIMYEDFFEGMTKQETRAILFHEIGHIENGDHLRNITDTAVKRLGNSNIMFETEREISADEFAVIKTSKEDMRNALTKILRNTAKVLMKYVPKTNGVTEDDLYEQMVSEEHIQKRLAALAE